MELSKDELKLIIKEAIQEALLSSKLEKVTLTIEECVNYTGIGRDKIMELAHGENDFPAFRVGKKFLINKEMLCNWLEKIASEKRIL